MRIAAPLELNPAVRNDPAKIDQVSRQLEGQFAQMLVKSMRDASFGDSLFPGENETFRDLYDQHLAKALTEGKGLGLSAMIARRLGGGTAAAKPLDASINPAQAARAYALASGGRDATLPLPPASADAGTEQALDLIAGRPADAARRPDDAAAFAWPTADGRPGNADANEAASDASFTAGAAQAAAAQLGERTPEGFVARVWHHAQKAARELGVDPRALVAQAALETGWGRRGIARGDGGDSHNLFGIKAAGWNGERAVAGTHEYVDGVRRGETATFRAYRSVEESFSDYVRLLKNDGRYRQALRAGADIHGFARGLQQAGYATDPGYAAKIAAIATGPTIGRAVSAIGDAAARLARSFAGNAGGIAQR